MGCNSSKAAPITVPAANGTAKPTSAKKKENEPIEDEEVLGHSDQETETEVTEAETIDAQETIISNKLVSAKKRGHSSVSERHVNISSAASQREKRGHSSVSDRHVIISNAANEPDINVENNNVAKTMERSDPGDGRLECDICGRYFAEDRIEKHKEICEKTASKTRKVFDPTKARTSGTEAEAYIKKGAHLKEPKTPKKQDWRQKREEFVGALREAKKVQAHLNKGGKLEDLPPPPVSENPDYVKCPHCGRRFNPGAADRHIPKCQNIKSNKKR